LCAEHGTVADIGLGSCSGPLEAYGVNSAGVVVGMMAEGAALRAYRWSKAGGFVTLPATNMPTASANAINDSGVAVGFAQSGATRLAMMWRANNTPMMIGDLPGGPTHAEAKDINASGIVVGFGTTATGSQAFKFNPLTCVTTPLPDDHSADSSVATAINNLGVAVGYVTYGTTPGSVTAAVRWDEAGNVQTISACVAARANDVNKMNQIVGNMSWGDTSIGAMWTQNDWGVDLNTLVDESGAGWSIIDATAINDAGQIVARATNPDVLGEGVVAAVLLTPIAPCDDVDFNNDGVFPDNADVAAFFSAFAGGACVGCNDLDFNNDAVFPDLAALNAFPRSIAGEGC
jgi:hypothetical protein